MLEADYLPGRTLIHNGREYLYCSGTGYLGTARNPAFAALLAEGLSRYGTNYGNSRNGPLRLRIYEEAESYLAHHTGAEAALTVSSGYLAGQMAVKALAGAGRFEYAPGTHPAAWLTEHAPMAVSKLSFDEWAADLMQRLQQEPPEPVVIVSNSLDALRVQRYDFSWTQHLPADRPITLLIDDSHGFGVIGPDGAGIWPELRVPASVRVVVVSSMGKACGIPSGVVLADTAFIEDLRRSPFFGASSPVVPAYLYAFLQAAGLYQQARAQLQANVQQFTTATSGLSLFQSAPGFPVFYTLDNGFAEYMQEKGILLSSFCYPTPADPCITRVVLSALHTAEDVKRIAEVSRAYATEKPAR
ncbi:aminotransferase class I/II-fold pyridoxal phosphate-dependent enzyme [Hymenobacter koreensis]|uniref:8-amino-7-oxononanoate synthase n=1 Tax=Hymenobacter koreensis TaxID=1084523 RepID=A0ABP8JHQ6_9BACT